MKDETTRNWSELPPELTSSFLLRLNPVEILETAQRVCRSWRHVCKEPSMWRKIDMRNLGNREIAGSVYCEMTRNAVNRSDGGLVEINIGFGSTDSLLHYIAHKSSKLRSLALAMSSHITGKGLAKVAKLPLLEELELEVSNTWSKLDLKEIGHACPSLKTLKVNCTSFQIAWYKPDDDDAFAIAETMPQLRHLQLMGNRLTETGLNAILDNCPNLEHLDLRMCMNIYLSKNLEKLCMGRVNEFRRPNDSTSDYPYYDAFGDTDSDDDKGDIEEGQL